MAMKIGISFKENERPIYDHIKKQLSESVYIKQLVINDMKKDIKPDRYNQSNTKNNLIDWD